MTAAPKLHEARVAEIEEGIAHHRRLITALEAERDTLLTERMDIKVGDTVEGTAGRCKDKRGIVWRIDPRFKWIKAKVFRKDGTLGREMQFYDNWRKIDAPSEPSS